MSASALVDPWGIREKAYRSNAWMTDEMLGAPRWPLLTAQHRQDYGRPEHDRPADKEAEPCIRSW